MPEVEGHRSPPPRPRRQGVSTQGMNNVVQKVVVAADMEQEVTLSTYELRCLKAVLGRLR